MDNPLVSIIIPSFNNAHFLDRLIPSILSQTYSNWEVIFIDNNSKDNTIEILNSYEEPRIKIYSINNEGIIAKSRNLGIEKAKGEWIAFLDSDDWWVTNKLLVAINTALEKKADFVYHDMYLAKQYNNYFNKKGYSRGLKPPIFRDLLIRGNGILNSSVIVKKEFLIKVGLLATQKDRITWEDYDCWLRISQQTENFFYIKKILGYYWIGGGNMTNPDRDLQNANSVTENYIKPNLTFLPSWILISKGKALIKKGMIDDGIELLKGVTLFKYPFSDVIRSFAIIFLAKVNLYFK